MLKNPDYVYGPQDILIPAKINLGQFLLEKLNKYQHNVYLINGLTDERITYGEILQHSMNLAISLAHLRVRKGQTIGICSENRNEYFGAVIGSVCAGAIVTAFNTGYVKGEMKHVLNISKPKIMFCSPLQYKTHYNTWKSTDYIETIILFGNDRPDDNVLLYNDLIVPSRYNSLNNNVKYEEFEVVDVTGQTDTCLILYSSGTTGLPKGVMLTHLNVITSCCQPPSHDVTELTITVIPWFHTMGLVGNMAAIPTGRTVVYLPKFDMDTFLRCIEKYKIPQIIVVPPILVALAKIPIKYDISSVKLFFSGAAPLHKDTLKALKKKFPNRKIMQGYGMTELTLSVTRDTIATQHMAKPGGVGFVVAGSVIKVVDIESRKPLGPNQRGEICVKGNVMKGYLGVDSKNDFDDEGFFKTGDIGYYDYDRYFFILDRLKELIKYKGFQVPPAEIEALLLQHPAVKDVGVVGIPHQQGGGEVPRAYVVLQPRVGCTAEELQRFVADNLSNPKHLRGGVKFIEQIPKSLSGKILRRELKKMALTDKSKL